MLQSFDIATITEQHGVDVKEEKYYDSYGYDTTRIITSNSKNPAYFNASGTVERVFVDIDRSVGEAFGVLYINVIAKQRHVKKLQRVLYKTGFIWQRNDVAYNDNILSIRFDTRYVLKRSTNNWHLLLEREVTPRQRRKVLKALVKCGVADEQWVRWGGLLLHTGTKP